MRVRKNRASAMRRVKLLLMSAGQAAGLLVLLGVVGVLAAIVGSGLEAGPVKFPSIPRSRQKPLALASAVVIVGGAVWWVLQRQSGTGAKAPSGTGQTGPAPTGTLTVVLIPPNQNLRIGDPLPIQSQVDDSNSNQLGNGQCVMHWSDPASSFTQTTGCNATVTEPPLSAPGVHLITVKADGISGLHATGVGRVSVTVTK